MTNSNAIRNDQQLTTVLDLCWKNVSPCNQQLCAAFAFKITQQFYWRWLQALTNLLVVSAAEVTYPTLCLACTVNPTPNKLHTNVFFLLFHCWRIGVTTFCWLAVIGGKPVGNYPRPRHDTYVSSMYKDGSCYKQKWPYIGCDNVTLWYYIITSILIMQ